MALNTTTGSGTQSATGTPQSVGSQNTNAATSGSVQPGTASNLLSNPAAGSTAGISLTGSQVTTVDLTGTSATTQTATTQPPAQPHHVNTVALGVCAVLAIVAVLVFVSMSRSAKNTTH